AKKPLSEMKARVRQITARNAGRSINQVAEELRRYLVGWREYYRLAQTPGVFGSLDEWLRHRLRALHLKQWKRGRVIYRELRARGVSKDHAAQIAGNARRWWYNSSRLLNRALPNRYFDQLGIPRLAAGPQLTEPPGADPHAGWCGRGRGVTTPRPYADSPSGAMERSAARQTIS